MEKKKRYRWEVVGSAGAGFSETLVSTWNIEGLSGPHFLKDW